MTVDYEMFSEEGNLVIDSIVTEARVKQLTWPEVYQKLKQASQSSIHLREAMDTAVREVVYDTLGFKTPFYV